MVMKFFRNIVYLCFGELLIPRGKVAAGVFVNVNRHGYLSQETLIFNISVRCSCVHCMW